MFVRRLPVFLLLLAVGVLPAKAQSRRQIFSIGGNVLDGTDHHPMESVQVTLKSATSVPMNSAYTRGDGEFQFDGLGNGDYTIVINVKNYDLLQKTITISGASILGLYISLDRTIKGVNPGMQMSISAHQLSVPHKAHDEFERGMNMIYMKVDYRAAIPQFQLAIKDFPTYYEAYAEEGNAYYQLEEMGPAEEALRKSIELSSGQYADAMFTLAALLTDAKNFKEAETISRKGIAVDSSSWRGPFELARALTSLKQSDEAEKSAQQSRDLMPDNPPVYLLLANIHIQRKDYPALLRDLDDYLRLSPLGAEADQARKTREHVQALMNAPKADSAGGGTDKADDDDDDADTDQEKNASSPPAQDNSGLPSLPPPTAGNQ